MIGSNHEIRISMSDQIRVLFQGSIYWYDNYTVFMYKRTPLFLVSTPYVWVNIACKGPWFLELILKYFRKYYADRKNYKGHGEKYKNRLILVKDIWEFLTVF